MKPILAILLLLVFAVSGMSQAPHGTFKFETKQKGHKALIIFRTGAFEPRKHRIAKDRSYQPRVDGRLAHGTDGNVPKREIREMKLWIDGRPIAIPRHIYSDCFEPNLDQASVKVRFVNNFQSVIVSMSGSDGAGGYHVIWRLRKTGKHSRSISTS